MVRLSGRISRIFPDRPNTRNDPIVPTIPVQDARIRPVRCLLMVVKVGADVARGADSGSAPNVAVAMASNRTNVKELDGRGDARTGPRENAQALVTNRYESATEKSFGRPKIVLELRGFPRRTQFMVDRQQSGAGETYRSDLGHR